MIGQSWVMCHGAGGDVSLCWTSRTELGRGMVFGRGIIVLSSKDSGVSKHGQVGSHSCVVRPIPVLSHASLSVPRGALGGP